MKKIKIHSREINSVPRREHLPLLRGMFVSPETADNKNMSIQRNASYSFMSEDELFLTAKEGLYLGE